MKRILIVSQNDLLQIGIQRLLGAASRYTIHQSCSLDESEIAKQIQQLNLDVIIIEAKAGAIETGSLTRWFNASKDLRVLTLEVNSNAVQIYEKREVHLQVTEDLIAYV